MSSGIAVDANVMNLFSQNLIRKETGAARTLVERIDASHGFAIDAGGKIENQWLTTCDKTYFGNWFVEGLKNGHIRKVAAKLDSKDEKHLRIDCGMPTARCEITYVAVANVVQGPRYVVTEDIDFWEPSAKAANAKTKEGIKARRTGCVCRHLRSLGITVGTVSQGLAEL